MSRIRDIANLFSANTDMATDAEVTSSIASHAASADPHTVYLKESEFNAGGKNYIINGGFDFWQRATSYSMTSSWAYGAPDRWGMQQYPTGGACTVSRSPDVPTGAVYSLKMQRTASSTNTSSMGIMQCIESSNAILLQGKTVTLSFWAKAGANFSGGSINAKIQTGTSPDEVLGLANGSYTGNVISANTSPTITTSWVKYSVSVTLASNIKEISININWAGSGTAGADDSVYISNIQLEEGSTATPFSRAGGDISGELAKCQRYYQSPGTVGHVAYSGDGVMGFVFPVTMRTTPTTSFGYNGTTNATYQIQTGVTRTLTSPIVIVSNTGVLNMYAFTPSSWGQSAGTGFHIQWTMSAEI